MLKLREKILLFICVYMQLYFSSDTVFVFLYFTNRVHTRYMYTSV